tara:strand:- start:251 stop:541 length:291 start_codon:yes stop_codon:yes gene_type:complete
MKLSKRQLKRIIKEEYSKLLRESTGVANEQRYLDEIEMMLDDYKMGKGFEFDTEDRQEYEEFKAVLDFHFPQYKNVYLEDEDYDPEMGTVYILTMY